MYLLLAWICPYIASLFEGGQSPLTTPLHSQYQGANNVGYKFLNRIINTKFLTHQLPSPPALVSTSYVWYTAKHNDLSM